MSAALERAARRVALARDELAVAMTYATNAAISAHREGMPETEIAKALGVNRLTVRRWLGK